MFELGTGAYTLPDAARLLGEPAPRLRGWAQRYWSGRGYARLGGEQTIDFLTLIELKTFAQLRAMGIATRDIEGAARELERITGEAHPFAHRSILSAVGASGKKVYWEVDGVHVSLDGTRQFALGVIEDFLRHLEFDDNGHARTYRPAAGRGAVELHAGRRFGQPIVTGTNVEVSLLCRMSASGDPPELLSDEYDIPLPHVRSALAFCPAA